MKTFRTIDLDGTSYAVPASLSDKDLAAAAAILLLLQRVDYCCDSEYRKSFHYTEHEGARLRLGTRAVYESREQAEAARDAHNVTLAAQAQTA